MRADQRRGARFSRKLVAFIGRTNWMGRVRWLVALALGCAATAAENPRTAALARDLESSDPKVRREAAYQLSRLGPEASSALPQLIKALGDDQQQVWFGAITTLANLGPTAEPALPALLSELENWQPSRRDRQGGQALYRTAFALGAIGPAAVPSLSNRLSHVQWHVRAGAVMALGFAGEPARSALPEVIRLLVDGRGEVREAAAGALESLAPASIDPLVRGLQESEDARLRATAASVLGRIGSPAAESSRPALQEALARDRDATVRASAVKAWSRVERRPARSVPILMAAWNDPDGTVRAAAQEALLLVRPVEPELTGALAEELKAGEGPRRSRAIELVRLLGPDARALADTVTGLLDEEAKASHRPADPSLVRALASMGPSAMESIRRALADLPMSEVTGGSHWAIAAVRTVDVGVVPGLSDWLVDSRATVRAGGLEALAALGPGGRPLAKAVPPLLEDPDPAVRARAWLAAAACGTAPAALLGKLEAGLKDGDAGVRRAAVRAVASLGREAAPALPRLVREGLTADDVALRRETVKTLGSLGSEAGSVADALVAVADTPDGELRREVVEALGRIGGTAKSALPKLLEMLGSDDARLRRAILEAVGRWGESAGPAADRVRQSLGDADPEVRGAAVTALAAVAAASETTVAALVAALEDGQSVVRHAAAAAAGQLGEGGRPAEGRLFEMLKTDEDWRSARDALRAIHPRSVPALLTALDHEDWTVREMAADSLARLGKAAAEALPSLEERVRDDPREEVKRACRRAARRIREA